VGVGVLTLYVACFTDVTGVTYNAADEYVTGITGTIASGYTSGFFFEFGVPFESTNFDVELIVSKQNNNYMFNPKINFKLASIDPDVVKLYESFAAAKVMVIVKTHQDRYFLLGMENGLIAETGNLTTGTAAGDFKGLTMLLSSFGESKSVREIDTASVTIANLVATL